MKLIKILLPICLISISVMLGLVGCSPAPLADGSAAPGDPAQIVQLEADGPLSAAMADYLERGLKQAQQDQAEAVILMLNTPGGAVDLMNRMVQDIRNSPVPVIVYVAPRGAMAASAGTVITLAGHAAAMAPDTVIGAASPVDISGQDIPTTEEQKLKETLQATVRSLAERRPSTAVSLAEETIETARAVSASEALQVGLVDFIAADTADLLQQADGFEVVLSGQTRRLDTANAQIEVMPATLIDTLLNFLTNPNFVFLLLNVGILAILIEISAPGGWLAGFIGVVCLALAVYGLGVLPVNWFGLVFIVIAIALFVLDIKAPTHGALTAAGVGAFIAGALILFNSVRAPEFQPISIPLVVISALASGGMFAAILSFALRAQRTPVRAGMEALVNQVGTVKSALDPRGQVQVAGELWTAEVSPEEAPLARGARVRVIAVDGLRLRVTRTDDQALEAGDLTPKAESKNSTSRV
jgi:membrane-bound serine protease (ClpP class)